MGMEAFHISFILRATYDVLPSPSNLNQWYGEDPTCPLCPSPANLKHILVGCKTSLSQGRYTWRHNHVLKCLAATLEVRRRKINALPPTSVHPSFAREFIREGVKTAKVHIPSDIGQLGGARDWKLAADLNQRLCFPSEIAITNLRPDLVLWSSSLHTVYIIELTVPWEAAVEEAFERKSLKYTELAVEAEQRGWKSKVCPVEVGCRGFVGKSTIRLLKELGVRGQTLRQTIKALSGAAEEASRWLWVKRGDSAWAPNNTCGT